MLSRSGPADRRRRHGAKSAAVVNTMLATAAILFVLAVDVRAAHVVAMDAATLANEAGQVFVGDVVAVRSYWADSPRRIETQVDFRNVRYLKGSLAGTPAAPVALDAFTLLVPGGSVGAMQMQVCCAPQFGVGERWMLFLLPSYHTFPVVGLYQGAFRIETDAAGVSRVLDASRRPVSGLDEEGFVAATSTGAGPRHRHDAVLPSAEDRVRVIPPEEGAGPRATDDPISLAEFERLLAPVLAASRVHRLTEPAGRPDFVSLTPVPLQLAPGAAAVRGAAARPVRGADAVDAVPAAPRSAEVQP